MPDRVCKTMRSGPGGFTLIELMVATAISALVIGIISVCLSFSLRVWQKTVRAKPDHTLLMAELLQRQLSQCDPRPINFEHGSRPLFQGKSDSICFITSDSVKAISKGVPVAVRYTYDPGSRVLSYAELVMDPYRTQALEQFAAGGSPSGTQVRAYRVDFPKFSLAYAGKEAREFSGSWLSTEALPVEILLKWKGVDGVAHSMVCMVNSPFAIESNFLNASTPGGLNQ
ncbi:MAG: PulJ/GspJ family protein [Syntrophobacteraceae bacterium]